MKFYIFNNGDFRNQTEFRLRECNNKIINEDESYFLNVNEEEYISYLYEKYKYNSLNFLINEEFIEEERGIITYHLPFKGDGEILKYKPKHYLLWTCEVFFKNNCLCFEIEYNENPDDLESQIKKIKENIFKMYSDLDKEINEYNILLNKKIEQWYKNRKDFLLKKYEVLDSISIPLKRRSDEVTFAVSPPIKKRLIKPKQNQNNISDPRIIDEDYQYILKILYNVGKAFERLPSTYTNKKEEDLRDHLLLVLTPHFEGSVTGETFNNNGKTDILYRYENTNVFVAECKFWHGKKEFQKTIDQLLGYLTWRDSKTAIILFVREKNISKIVEKVKKFTLEHSNFVRENKHCDDSWLNYTFHLNGDANREFKLAILIVHIPN